MGTQIARDPGAQDTEAVGGQAVLVFILTRRLILNSPPKLSLGPFLHPTLAFSPLA